MADIEKIQHKCRHCWVVFAICLAVSVGLLVAGFLVPPTGIIDGSVLKGVGELIAFASLAVGGHAITLGYDVKLAKGDASVVINNN